jgi:hypothetical protein
MCNKIVRNYLFKEDQVITVTFGTWDKQRLDRVMNTLGFEYQDYPKLDNDVKARVKRKITVSVIAREVVRGVMAKKQKTHVTKESRVVEGDDEGNSHS